MIIINLTTYPKVQEHSNSFLSSIYAPYDGMDKPPWPQNAWGGENLQNQ
jgi:hypothetical protein